MYRFVSLVTSHTPASPVPVTFFDSSAIDAKTKKLYDSFRRQNAEQFLREGSKWRQERYTGGKGNLKRSCPQRNEGHRSGICMAGEEVRIRMKLKKISAFLGLLSIFFLLLHVGYSVFCYLTMYYNPQLKYIMAIPFIVLVCLHAVCGMASVFLQADGTRMDLYPGKNMRTILQRVSAALIFPLLILHLYTFSLMKSSAESGNPGFIVLLILAELLFFACVITHVVVSLTKGLITLGLLSSQKVQKMIDRILYVAGAVVFFVSAFAVIRGQAAMFLH